MLIEITYNVTDVFMSTTETPVYVEISFEQPGGSAAVWGSITGTLSNQTDLQNALNLKVPYTGATTNVNLGEYELKAGQVTLDTSPTGTAAVGTIRWNDTTGTSETTLKGGNVIIKNGVDLVARVVNKVTPNTTLTKAAYQAVRVSGAQGQRLAIELAQANNDAGSADTIGLVTETIAPNQEGFIMTVGQLEGINTTGSLQGETWVDGDVLYLSPTTAGRITNVKPTGATGHLVIIGYVEYAHANNGKLYIKVANGFELDELHNVSIVTPTNNQGLFYNSSNSLWENKTISTALGYTPVPTTRNITINGVTYDLSADRTWTIAAGISGSGASGQVTYWTGASAVSGSNNLFWDNANSRLGIGTNSPLDFNLVVQGAMQVRSIASAFQGIRIDSTSIRVRHSSTFSLGTNDSAIAISMFAPTNNVGINTTSDLGVRFGVVGDTLLRGSGSTIATTALTVQNSSSTNLLRVLNDGDVSFGADAFYWDAVTSRLGIGTNAPAYKLEVSSSSGTGASGILVKNQGTGTTDFASINFQNNLTPLSNIFYTASTYTNSGLIAANGFGHYTEGSGGLTLWANNGIIKFATGTTSGAAGSQKMTLFTTGNLGIGTGSTDNGQRLQVIGDTLLRGSGATSATTALTVQNSSSVNLFELKNNGELTLGIRSGGARPSLTIGSSFSGNLNFTTINFANWDTTVYAVFSGIDSASSTFIFGGTSINASAKLQINSTTSGFLPPRMTTTQKNAISSPAAGLVVYDTTDNKHYGYDGTTWNAFY